jgi:hypothetical protein
VQTAENLVETGAQAPLSAPPDDVVISGFCMLLDYVIHVVTGLHVSQCATQAVGCVVVEAGI